LRIREEADKLPAACGGRRLHGPHIFFFFLGAALLLAVNLHLDSAFRDGYLLGSVGETVFPGG
jgi:hypothetical protein